MKTTSEKIQLLIIKEEIATFDKTTTDAIDAMKLDFEKLVNYHGDLAYAALSVIVLEAVVADQNA